MQPAREHLPSVWMVRKKLLSALYTAPSWGSVRPATMTLLGGPPAASSTKAATEGTPLAVTRNIM